MLAKAVGQSALMLDVPRSSRASFAPTVWIGARLGFPGQQKSPVGAALAREGGGSVCLDVACAAVIASKLCSHRLDRCPPGISRPKNPLWEQSLLAKAVGQSALMLDVPRSSRASFAPNVWVGARLGFPGQQKSPVGAELAREGGGSVCLDVACAAVIASKLCSHRLGRCPPGISRPTKIPVGAELAREGGGSVCLDVGCAAVIASKLCSHRLDRCPPGISRPTKIPCGSKACWRRRWVSLS